MTDLKLVMTGISKDGGLKVKENPLSAGDAVMHNDQHKDSATGSSPQISVFGGAKSAALNGVVTDSTSANGDGLPEARLGMDTRTEAAVNPTNAGKGSGV